MSLGVGIDLVSVDEAEAAIDAHGERYLRRVYTELERLECDGDPGRLAVRFAAKEATMKALRRCDEPLEWRWIEVRLQPDGQATLELAAGAARLARRRGVRRLSASVTRTGGLAMALVLAEADR